MNYSLLKTNKLMKQLNNNTFGKNSWNCHWEKLCFLRNTLGKIPGVATVGKLYVL